MSLAAGLALAGPVGCSDGVDVPNPLIQPKDGPPAGNPNAEATCTVPTEAGLADVSKPTTIGRTESVRLARCPGGTSRGVPGQ